MTSTYCEIHPTGSDPTFAGKPGKQNKPTFRATSGALVDNWHMCVKNITVSSRENQAMRLIDGNEGYWQSSGTQGKVWLVDFFYKCVTCTVDLWCRGFSWKTLLGFGWFPWLFLAVEIMLGQTSDWVRQHMCMHTFIHACTFIEMPSFTDTHAFVYIISAQEKMGMVEIAVETAAVVIQIVIFRWGTGVGYVCRHFIHWPWQSTGCQSKIVTFHVSLEMLCLWTFSKRCFQHAMI